MPRSLARRVELLERRPRKSLTRSPAPVLAMLERMVKEGHPLTLTPVWVAAWTAYQAARDRTVSDPTPPDPDFIPDEPESERQRLWPIWGDRRLDDQVSAVLAIYLEAADAAAERRRQGGGR